ALLVRHDFVGVTVDDEDGAVVVGNFAEGVHASAEEQVHGEPGRVALGGGGQRGEGAGEDEAAGTVARGKLDGDSAADGSAHQDDVAFGDVSGFGEPGTGGAGVLIEARLGWSAFAFAEAA